MGLIIYNYLIRKIIQIMFLRVRKLLNYKIPKYMREGGASWDIIWVNKNVLFNSNNIWNSNGDLKFKRFGEYLSESLVNQK